MTEEEKPHYYETATAERIAKAQEATEPFKTDSGRNTLRMLDGHVLEALYSKGTIDGAQYVAGNQFYSDWYYAGLASSGVVDPAREIVDSSRRFDPSASRLDAANKWSRAVIAIGKIHSHSVINIVLLEQRLDVYAAQRFPRITKRAYAKEKAVDALRKALNALVDYYKILPPRKAGIVSAHTEDYRPDLPDVEP